MSTVATNVIFEKQSNLPVEFKYKVTSIEIDDQRGNKYPNDMKLPFMSTPGQTRKSEPSLISKYKDIINNTILNNCIQTGEEITVIVRLKEASKNFEATMWNEKEEAIVELDLDKKVGENSIINICSSEAKIFLTSGDAKEARLEQLYQYALKTALINCMKKAP